MCSDRVEVSKGNGSDGVVGFDAVADNIFANAFGVAVGDSASSLGLCSVAEALPAVHIPYRRRRRPDWAHCICASAK